MGRNNRARRAAKQRDRRRAAAGPEAASARFPDGAARVPPAVALLAAARCRCADAERHAVELLGEYRHSGSELDVAADAVLTRAVRGAWTAGWAPTDLQELARRVLEPTAAGLLLEHIVVESRTYAGATLHPRWRAALDAVAAGVGHEITDGPRLRSWVARTGDGRVEVLAALLRVLTVLDGLPVLERLVPLPGVQRHESSAGGQVDRKVLVRVRALLAKAESTEFPDEAEALSAKAQELMSRYSLGQAVLEHDRGRAPAAAGRRLWPPPTAAARCGGRTRVSSRWWGRTPSWTSSSCSRRRCCCRRAGRCWRQGGRSPAPARRGPARSGSPSSSPMRAGSASGSRRPAVRPRPR
jgi:hypothetical protein